MRKDPTEFRKRFAKWKEGGKPYKDGKISDEQYVSIMENVAADNWLLWGDESEDAALTRILNDNAYDYRGYYNDNPGSAANADTHWPDKYKTVWHPTFSNQSKYSGKKSQYNPYGYPGGTWQGELFNPQWYQQHLGTGFYKDGYPKLPKFEGGEEKFKLKKTPEFVQAGKDNSWSKVTNDNMGEVFQSVVARPNRTGGNTSSGSWKELWEPKQEKGLEIVSPEFDLVSLGVAGAKELKHLKLFKRVVKNPNTSGDLLRYDLYDWKGRSKGRINVHTYDNTPEVGYVESKIPGGSRALYDAVIEDVTNRGMPGLYSGRDLLSAPKTYSVWKHYKDKQLIGRYGTHNNLRMPGVDGTVSFSGDYNKMLLNWKNNIADGFYNGEVYLLKTPSQKVMSSSYLPRIDNVITGVGNPLFGHLFTKYAE